MTQQETEGREMNAHEEYAQRYSCTIADSIHDREYPMNERECIAAFTEAAGRSPTLEEVQIMRPDSDNRTAESRAEFDAEWASY